ARAAQFTPAATPTPTPLPTAAQPQPNLTAEEEALNRQAIENFQSSMASVDSYIEMQVAIAEGVPETTLSFSSTVTLKDQDGNPLHTVSPEQSYSVRPQANGIAFGSLQLPAAVVVEIPLDQVFRLGDRTYRGQLVLVTERGYLWAVNSVSMRQYLYSVVASEVSPSWNVEALKAQAVAARSYALTFYFNPVNSLYHIGATQRHQVYSGIGREDDRTSQAVDLTAGEFVSHEGGIVQSLYAASDKIVAEVFRGQGMSQLGALNLAEQGYSYEQILSNYYPGTALARIEESY
ncbi:MAG: SpoIID/LytB domain-containing protein, partial [Leptolyngbyaceae cyanobacterium SL_7_1]|nr:SpoIID/LytB domain-containing protein [Leptolyngbyaceae cyanobacterium SL_7_1]